MKRTALIFLLGLAGVIGLAFFEGQRQDAALVERLETERANIEALRDGPAYRRLIGTGSQICRDQTDQVIWICGATIRVPQTSNILSSRGPLCSSAEAPIFVGTFALPEVTSAEHKTAGQQLRPNIPNLGPKGGHFAEIATLAISFEALPSIESCQSSPERICAGLSLLGQRSFRPAWMPEDDIPNVLLQQRPAPDTLVSSPGRSPVFLDLDGQPVRHEVTRDWMRDALICSFQVLHPMGGTRST